MKPLEHKEQVEKNQTVAEEAVENEENLQESEITASSEETINNQEELAKANATIEELKAKLDEAENKQLRMHADFENFKRRLQNEKLTIEKYKAQSVVTDLLPALDNFERALKVEQVDEKLQPFIQGMEMVYKSILEVLKNEGVEQIEAVGQPFDPHLHQAVMQECNNEYEPNTIIEEFQKGYKLKDRVIRPSMVKVNE